MENIYYVQYVLFPILPTFFTWEFSILKAPKYYCFIISDSCVSQNFVDTFHNLLLGWVQLEERILLLVSTPCSLLGLLFGCILVINILLTKSLHKPRHLFQALAVCSSLARWCFRAHSKNIRYFQSPSCFQPTVRTVWNCFSGKELWILRLNPYSVFLYPDLEQILAAANGRAAQYWQVAASF